MKKYLFLTVIVSYSSSKSTFCESEFHGNIGKTEGYVDKILP